MHDHQPVDEAGGERPAPLLAQHGNVGLARRPGHHALWRRHQRDNPARRGQEGPQQGRGEAETHDGFARRPWPELHDAVADRPLRRTAEARLVVEGFQVLNVQMHCGAPAGRISVGVSIRDEASNAMPLQLVTVPCLTDNYAYIVHDAGSGATAVVDVPEAGPVRAALAERGWQLTDILLTHHHPDHIAGVEALRRESGAQVWGNAADAARLPPLDRAVTPGQRESFAGEGVEIIDVPGHTIGHIAYHLPGSQMLFTGDSLMSLGCGRLFEGEPAQMLDSLTRLAGLPDDTIVGSGHEYTKTNARFALTVDSGNEALRARADRVTAARDAGTPTVPVSLGEEKATNPFLRADDPGLRAHIGMHEASDLEVFAEIRRRRDGF